MLRHILPPCPACFSHHLKQPLQRTLLVLCYSSLVSFSLLSASDLNPRADVVVHLEVVQDLPVVLPVIHTHPDLVPGLAHRCPEPDDVEPLTTPVLGVHLLADHSTQLLVQLVQ